MRAAGILPAAKRASTRRLEGGTSAQPWRSFPPAKRGPLFFMSAANGCDSNRIGIVRRSNPILLEPAQGP